jgi:hypothetical protein
VLLAVLIAVLVTSWARRDPRPGRAELFYVAAVCAFASMAFRNVVPALLLLAPLVALRLQVAGEPNVARSSARDLARASVVGVLTAGLLSAALIQADADPFGGKKAPTHILAEIQARAPARLATTYNLGGFFAGLGGPGVVVSIDGRTDYYGADYIRAQDALYKALPGWQATLAKIDPDIVVLQADDALREILVGDGWTEVVTDKGYVMLVPADTASTG